MNGHRFHPTILREYDIRGTVGETLFPEDARAVGRAFATVVRARGGRRVCVGRDGRLSSRNFTGRWLKACAPVVSMCSTSALGRRR